MKRKRQLEVAIACSCQDILVGKAILCEQDRLFICIARVVGSDGRVPWIFRLLERKIIVSRRCYLIRDFMALILCVNGRRA